MPILPLYHWTEYLNGVGGFVWGEYGGVQLRSSRGNPEDDDLGFGRGNKCWQG